MASTTQELIKKGFQISNKGISTSFRQKIEMISSHYGSVNSFLKAKRSDFEKIVYVVDKPNFKLTYNEYQKLLAFQKSGLIDSKLSVQQNFVNILTTQFISRQLEMIESLKLESLNVNPILASALNLNNETDLIRYYVYQAISRSIVTSVGFLVQDLLLYASDIVVEGRDDELGEETKWDLVVEKLDEVKAFLEIKSGTNDVNKAQIHHYRKEFEFIENKGFKAFIGETYGKRADQTVTHGLYKQYLPDWEKRTLIGKELWAFVSGEENYHQSLIDHLFKTSSTILRNDTFIKKIEKRIKPLILEFRTKHKNYQVFLKSLW